MVKKNNVTDVLYLAGWASCFIFLFITIGCVNPSRSPGLTNKLLPDLIPREIFFDYKNRTNGYQISPDGSQLAWVGFHEGIFTLFHKKVGSKEHQVLSTQTWCNVLWYRWEKDSRHLIYSLETGPKSPNHIFRLDTKHPDEGPVNLTPKAKTLASLESVVFPGSEYALISQNIRDLHNHDLYKINLDSGASTLLAENDEDILNWLIDRKGNLRGCIRAYQSNKICIELYLPHEKEWEVVGTWNQNEDLNYYGFTDKDNEIWLLSDRNRDKKALVRYNLNTGKESIVIENSIVDIEHVDISPTTGQALFAYSYPDFPKIYPLRKDLEKHLSVIKDSSHKGIEILGMDLSEQFWTVKIYNEKQALFYLYDKKRMHKELIGENRWSVPQKMLSETVPVKIKSRDNINLNGYLTRPRGTGNQPLPMVLLVHGGPWVRDYWGSDQLVQFLSNRGYTVLQINYRGSNGYGRKFQEAAINEFGQKMHFDLIDAVNWAVDQQITSPENIAIVGGSYGGYAAMGGLTFSPDVFSCAISINGVSDLVDIVESWPSNPPLYKKRGYDIWYQYVGDPKNLGDRKVMEQRSPLFFAEKVTKPILIVYGRKDRRVRPRHSIKMITELKRHRKSVQLLEIETEGHGIRWTHNSIEMYRKIEYFLARYLGGRYQR